jgi:hypothetical protein
MSFGHRWDMKGFSVPLEEGKHFDTSRDPHPLHFRGLGSLDSIREGKLRFLLELDLLSDNNTIPCHYNLPLRRIE